jgi:hypothetical protein
MKYSVSIEGNQHYFLCCVFTVSESFGFLNKIFMKCDTEGPYLAISTTAFFLNEVVCAKTNCIFQGCIGNCNLLCWLLFSPFLW